DPAVEVVHRHEVDVDDVARRDLRRSRLRGCRAAERQPDCGGRRERTGGEPTARASGGIGAVEFRTTGPMLHSVSPLRVRRGSRIRNPRPCMPPRDARGTIEAYDSRTDAGKWFRQLVTCT